MGPDTYDLASLLRDSYVELEPADVDALIARFLSLDRGPLGYAGDAARFRERFDTMAVQRNLKALGTFGYQASVRRKTAYLRRRAAHARVRARHLRATAALRAPAVAARAAPAGVESLTSRSLDGVRRSLASQ